MTVDGSSSTAPDGMEITGYHWNFGDDATADGAVASHTYDRPARNIVTLTITTERGVPDFARRPATTTCPPGDISPWLGVDIGAPGFPGSARLEGDGEGEIFRLCAGGAAISGREDECFFVYREQSGDFVMTARVSDLASTAAGAAVGLMIRESLSAGAASGAMLLEVEGIFHPAWFRFRARGAAGDELACEAFESCQGR